MAGVLRAPSGEGGSGRSSQASQDRWLASARGKATAFRGPVGNSERIFSDREQIVIIVSGPKSIGRRKGTRGELSCSLAEGMELGGGCRIARA